MNDPDDKSVMNQLFVIKQSKALYEERLREFCLQRNRYNQWLEIKNGVETIEEKEERFPKTYWDELQLYLGKVNEDIYNYNHMPRVPCCYDHCK